MLRTETELFPSHLVVTFSHLSCLAIGRLEITFKLNASLLPLFNNPWTRLIHLFHHASE